jgi:hypothetical protein
MKINFDSKLLKEFRSDGLVGLRVRFGAPFSGLNFPAVLMVLNARRWPSSVFIRSVSVVSYYYDYTFTCVPCFLVYFKYLPFVLSLFIASLPLRPPRPSSHVPNTP